MTATTWRILTEAEIHQMEEPGWLVDGLLPAHSQAMLYGPSGIGKSFGVLHLGAAIATGGSWLDRDVEAGQVLIIGAEGVWTMRSRLRAARRSFGVSSFDRLRVLDGAVHFHEPEAVASFLTALADTAPGPYALVVVDTLSRCSAGSDESSNAHRELTVDGLKAVQAATGATVLSVHHTGWDESRERGGYALRAAMDTVLALREVDGGLILEVEKQRNGPQGAKLPVVLHPAECLLLLDGGVRRESLARNEAAALQQLHRIALTDGIATVAWREACVEKKPAGPGLSRSGFYAARKGLITRAMVHEPRRGVDALTVDGLEAVQSPEPSK